MQPADWYRFLARLTVALGSFVVVSVTMVALTAAAGMRIDWNIPERTELLGPSELFDRNGVPLYRFAAEVERRPVPLSAISEHLQEAVIAAEDHRFYEHQGVDPLSVVRAVWHNARSGGIRQGGSTLTQQYVKNVYVGSDLTMRRKIREALVSLQLEKTRTKDEILEAYLNRVYFGDGAYGAEAAARTYFGKSAADLDLAEAATLAGILRSPSRMSPRVDPILARRRRGLVLDQMARYGLVSRAGASEAKLAPMEIAERVEQRPPMPYYVEEIRKQLLDDPRIGPERLYNGGLNITAALDVNRQAVLEEAVRPHVPEDTRFDAGVAVVEPSTGDVVAAFSGRDFEASQVDLALRQSSGRQSGSTFKVFALAAALEEGKTLASAYPAPGRVRISSFWQPRGNGGCRSPCPLLEAIVRSSNTVFAQLGRDVGVESFVGMAHRLGVRSALDYNPGEIAQVLGTSDVTPLDMASAFATFANDGVACPARLVTDIRDPEGAPVPVPDPRRPSDEQLAEWEQRREAVGYDLGEEELGRCYRALAPSVARQMNHALSQVVARGTGKGADIGRPQAGKTGTTDENRMAWFVGYTPDLSIAVSIGGRDAQVPLTDIPGCGEACYGGQLPATIWKDAATVLLDGVEPREFPELIDTERIAPHRRQLGEPMPPRPEPTPTATSPSPEPFDTLSPTPERTEWQPPEPDQTFTPSPTPTETPRRRGLIPFP